MEEMVKRKNLFALRRGAVLTAATMLCAAGIAQASDEEDDRRQQMRDFIAAIAATARADNPDFVIVVQNGLDLMTEDGDPDGPLVTDYISILDGVSQEGVSFGYDGYCDRTPKSQHRESLTYLERARSAGLAVLLTDYCDRDKAVAQASEIADERGFISFVSHDADFSLSSVPPAPNRPAKDGDVSLLVEAQNYLYLLNPEKFAQAEDLVGAVARSDFDVVIIDSFFRSDRPFAAADLAQMQRKPDGGRRLALAYLNVGSVENWRYYWQPGWRTDDPSWIGETYSDDYPDEFWARYWRQEWHDIIYRSDASYLRRVLDQGFDGVFLDNIDAYEIFED